MSDTPWSALSVFPERESRAKKSTAEANAAMWSALQSGDVEALREALEDGANPLMRPRGSKVEPPLGFALQKGAVDMATVLVEAGAPVSVDSSTFLLVAEADRPESFAWLMEHINPQKTGSMFDYVLRRAADSGHVRCALWMGRHHPGLLSAVGKDFGRHPLAGMTVLACTLPANRWNPALLREWIQVFSLPSMAANPAEVTLLWKKAIEENALNPLRALLGAGHVPLDAGTEPAAMTARVGGLPGAKTLGAPIDWAWHAASHGAADCFSWLMKVPAFEKGFVDLATRHPATTVTPLLQPKGQLTLPVLDALSAHRLLPSLEETGEMARTGSLGLFAEAKGLTKGMVETLARKWPDALRVTDAKGLDLIARFEKDAWSGKDKAVGYRMAMETILLKKAAGRAAPKSSLPPKRRL
jgi:hypothetical protein